MCFVCVCVCYLRVTCVFVRLFVCVCCLFIYLVCVVCLFIRLFIRPQVIHRTSQALPLAPPLQVLRHVHVQLRRLGEERALIRFLDVQVQLRRVDEERALILLLQLKMHRRFTKRKLLRPLGVVVNFCN